MKRGLFCALLALSLVLQAGCAAAPAKEGDRTVVTMMFTDTLGSFETLVETTYDDIDLQVERNAEATIDGESERRLHNGHGTDIVYTTMPTGDVSDFVMDLSAEPYVDRYQTAIFQNVTREGRTLFIPLPGQYYGYIVNASLLEEAGIGIPTSRPDLLTMLDTAAQRGVGVGEDGTLFGVISTMSVLSSWLLATQVPDFLSTAEGVLWRQDVLTGDATFVEGMAGCLDVLGPVADRGYMNTQALDLNYHDNMSYGVNSVPLETRMLSGTMLMVYGSTRLYNTLTSNSGEYEFAMLPLMSSQGNHPWTVTVPDGYLSINACLTQPGNEAKLDACSRVLDLLSTPEGQSAYLADCGVARSYLTSFSQNLEDVPDGIRECVEGGYVYNIQMPARLLTYFAQKIVKVLNGLELLEDALAEVDTYNREGDPEADYDQTLVGLMGEDLIYESYNVRLGETALGNLVADAVRERAGTDMAVVNGGSIRGSFYAGNVLGADLDAVCPYPSRIVAVEAKGSVIRETLANGVSALETISGIPGGRFLNVSGLCYSFSRREGDAAGTLLEVTLPDGTPLEDDRIYTLAINDYMAGSVGYLDNNGDGFTMLNLYDDDTPPAQGVTLLRETKDTYVDALQAYFSNHAGEIITAQVEGRIKVVTDDG